MVYYTELIRGASIDLDLVFDRDMQAPLPRTFSVKMRSFKPWSPHSSSWTDVPARKC